MRMNLAIVATIECCVAMLLAVGCGMGHLDYAPEGDVDVERSAYRRVPGSAVAAAHWDAERKDHLDANGGIISTDGNHHGSHRRYSGSGGQPSSPPWKRVRERSGSDNRVYKVVSQSGNGRSEQRILNRWNPRTDGARWFSFAVRIDPKTERKDGHFFFAQLHQSTTAGPQGNPPVFLQWTGSRWELVVRTDDGKSGANIRTVLASGPMAKGRWYEFKLKLQPGLDGQAEVKLWTRGGGKNLHKHTWARQGLNWGLAPRDTVGYRYSKDRSQEPWTHWNWKVGIYRGGSLAGYTVVYLDRLSFAKKQNNLPK